MTVVSVEQTRAFVGLSTDTKPAALAAAGGGATFYETDTGATYVWDGAAWRYTLEVT